MTYGDLLLILTSAEAAEMGHMDALLLPPLSVPEAFPLLSTSSWWGKQDVNPWAAGIWVTGHGALGMQSQEHVLL